MKAEYINPFIESSMQIFKTVANIELGLGKVFLKTDPYRTDDMLIMIGITGGLRGQVVMAMDNDIACTVASNMMGSTVSELDEIAQSALMELSNMVLGTASTILAQRGLAVDITPPSLLMGSNIKIYNNQKQTICVPLKDGNGGSVEINITMS